MFRKSLLSAVIFLLIAMGHAQDTGGGSNATSLQGYGISGATPTNSQCLVYLTSTTLWTPQSCPGGGGTTTNPLTMNNGGSGAASGATFNGASAVTLSYNTLGAAPTASPTFTGHITTEGITATGATGTGNFVFSASPTFTGTVIAAGVTLSGTLTTNLTGGPFCVHETSGVLSATASDCGSGGGAVTSVFGRTGAVVATTGDYTGAQIAAGAFPSGMSWHEFSWVEWGGVATGTGAALGCDLPSGANGASPVSDAGSTTTPYIATAQFLGTSAGAPGTQLCQIHFTLPDDLVANGVLVAEMRFREETDTTAAHNEVFDIAFVATSSTGTFQPTYGAYQTTTSTANVPSATTSKGIATLTLASVTAAGANDFYFQIGLDSTRTATGNVRVQNIRLKLLRNVTTQP